MTSVAAAAARGPLRCQLHPRELAGWRCTACHAPLCPDCAAQVTPERGSPYVTCGRCGAVAHVLTRARAEAMPMWRRLLRAPRYPLAPANLLALALTAAVLYALSFAAIGSPGLLVQGFRGGIFWSYVFFLIRNTGEGRAGTPGFRGLGEDLFLPLLRGLVGTALIWAPALLYFLVSPWTLADVLSGEVLGDPVPWLLALAGILYAPMALIAAATDIGVAGMLNPVQIGAYIRRVGRDYVVAVAALVLIVPLQVALVLAAGELGALVPVPFLGGFLVQLAVLYATVVWAHILGLVLHVHGHALDWGSEESYQEPVLGQVAPRGARVVAAPRAEFAPARIEALPLAAEVHAAAPGAPPAPGAYLHDARAIPLALDPGPVPGAPPAHALQAGAGVALGAALAAPALAFVPLPVAGAARAAAPAPGPAALGIQEEISLPPLPPPGQPEPAAVELAAAPEDGAPDTGGIADPDAFASMPDSGVVRMPEFLGPAAPVKEALAAKDFARAVELFAQEPAFLVLHLSPPEIFILAAALAQHKQVPLAISALKRIALSADPVAPKAMFLLARLYTDARHDYDNAERMFRALMQKYPDSKEADAARAHLRKLGY